MLAEHVANHGTTGNERWPFAGKGDDPPHQNTVGYWWCKTLREPATTTLNTYAQLWPTAEDRTLGAAESIMSASLGQPAAGLAKPAASTGE